MATVLVDTHTVNDILDRFVRENLPDLAKQTQDDYRRAVPILRATFGTTAAHLLRPADLSNFLNAGRARHQRGKQISVLSSAFSKAIEWGWLDGNVCWQVTRPHSRAARSELTSEEITELKRFLPPRVRHVVELVLLTGRSQGEIVHLRWAQVREDEKVIAFKVRGKAVKVPITRPIQAVLEQCRKLSGKGEYVIRTKFGKPYTSAGFRACWQRNVNRWEAAGNERIDFHDLVARARKVSKAAGRGFTFSPTVFSVPNSAAVEDDLVAVMMPLSAEFEPIFRAIEGACDDCKLKSLRASDIWEDAQIIQDIFSLIWRAHAVIVDFSRKNANVMYETGIAHTLGKHVIPITQAIEDVPFDIKHHRVLRYLPNGEGLIELRRRLASRLRFISNPSVEG